MNGFSWNYYAKRDNKKNMKQMKYLEICSVQLAFGMLLDMDRLYQKDWSMTPIPCNLKK